MTRVLMCKRDGTLSTLNDKWVWQVDEHYSVYVGSIHGILITLRFEDLGEL